MEGFNEPQARALWKSFKDHLCDTVTLREALAIFDLTIEEDGETIFNLLDGHVWYMNSSPSRKDLPSLWKVDFEGFKLLWRYAADKEETLYTFRHEFLEKIYKQQEKQKAKENNQ